MVASAAELLPYQEPGIVAVLILSSFLYLLNVITKFLDQWIYCGFLGQVFIGVCMGVSRRSMACPGHPKSLYSAGISWSLVTVYEGYGSPEVSTITLLIGCPAFRRSLYMLLITKGKLVYLRCCCNYGDVFANCAVFLPDAPSRCYTSPGICSWCSPVLHKSGHHFHSSEDKCSY